MKHKKKLDIRFFRNASNPQPVRDWLLSLPQHEKKQIGQDILKVQYCWPIGKPLVDGLGGGLWEVRSTLGSRIARVLFLVDRGEMILLHGFIKKTQKTPDSELKLAKACKRLFEKAEK